MGHRIFYVLARSLLFAGPGGFGANKDTVQIFGFISLITAESRERAETRRVLKLLEIFIGIISNCVLQYKDTCSWKWMKIGKRIASAMPAIG